MRIFRKPGAVEIGFQLAEPGAAHLDIFDIGGRVVRRIDESYPAGAQVMTWDGLDVAGQPVASGLYLYRLRADRATHITKGVWIRR